MTIKKLKLSITDSCEGKCAFCYRGPIHGIRHLPLAALVRSLDSISYGIGSIHISGGNPLLHPKFRDIVEVCRAKGSPIKLSANPGLLLGKYSWVLPLISTFSFSLESAEPAQHDKIRGISGDFAALAKLMNEGLNARSTIIIVITQENCASIPAMIDMAKSFSVQRIKVQLVEQSLLPADGIVSTFLDRKAEVALLNIFQRFSNDEQVEMIPLAATYGGVRRLVGRYLAGRVGPAFEEPAHCGYMLKNPHVKEDGTVYPCCGVSADRSIGNILEMPLAEILERHVAAQASHRSLPYASCQQCIFFSHYNPTERLTEIGQLKSSVSSRVETNDVAVD